MIGWTLKLSHAIECEWEKALNAITNVIRCHFPLLVVGCRVMTFAGSTSFLGSPNPPPHPRRTTRNVAPLVCHRVTLRFQLNTIYFRIALVTHSFFFTTLYHTFLLSLVNGVGILMFFCRFQRFAVDETFNLNVFL